MQYEYDPYPLYCRSFSDDLFSQAINVLKKIRVNEAFVKKFEDLQENLTVKYVLIVFV